MRVVVIGGTGHIGSYLVPRLVAAGHEVISVSRGKREPYHGSPSWATVRQVVTDRDAEERARWRAQALEWLRADLAACVAHLDGSPGGTAARGALQGWRREAALAGVRDPEGLAKLPEAERGDWLRLWAEVEAVLVRSMAGAAGK